MRVGCWARASVSRAWMEPEERFWVRSLIHSYFRVNESKNVFPHLSCRASGRQGVGAATFLPAWFEIQRFWGFARLGWSWSLQVTVIAWCGAWSVGTSGCNQRGYLVQEYLHTTKINKAKINGIQSFYYGYRLQCKSILKRESFVSLRFCFLLWLFIPHRIALEDSNQNMGLTLLWNAGFQLLVKYLVRSTVKSVLLYECWYKHNIGEQ